MSATPLSTTEERIERSIYERIRLELVDKGYLPDISAAPYNTGNQAAQDSWNTELANIATSQGFAIELLGAGSYDKNDDKKVPRIVIQVGEFIEGNLGGDQTRFFQLDDQTDEYDVLTRPPSFSDYFTNIHIVGNSTQQIRVMHGIVSLALQVKGYLPLYDVDPRVIQPSGNFFYKKVGAASLPNTEEGVIEKVYSFQITDVLESECPVEDDQVPKITDVSMQVDGQLVTNSNSQSSGKVTIQFQGSVIGSYPSPDTNFNVRLLDDDDNEIGTVETNDDNLMIIRFSTPSPPINTSRIWKSGQTSSNSEDTGDDGDTERGRGVDFLTLDHNNFFGNTDKLTDDQGGQAYSNGILCDWSNWNQITGDFHMWYKIPFGPVPYTTALSEIASSTQGGYNDWVMPNFPELFTLFNWGIPANMMNYPPLNIDLSTGSILEIWSGTVSFTSFRPMCFLGTTTMFGRIKTQANVGYLLFRVANVSELTP